MTILGGSIASAEKLPRHDGAVVKVLPLIMLLSFLATRPNILGEQYSRLGMIGAAIVGIFCLLFQARHTPIQSSSWAMLSAYTFGSMWAIWRVSNGSGDLEANVYGALIGLATLAGFVAFFANRDRAYSFARVLVIAIAAISLSSGVTFVMALTIGAIEIARMEVGTWSVPVYFPLTPASSHISYFGFTFDRFFGIGREPGWMGMYGALAWALWPHVMPRGRISNLARLLPVVGILTSGSTAGFGVFVIVATVDVFFREKRNSGVVATYTRTSLGVVALLGAYWLAMYAPQFGLAAKQTVNSESLEGRNLATEQGLDALLRFSLGEPSNINSPNVNLIAGVSENGWPYLALGLCAIVVPLLFIRSPLAAFPSLLTILLTMLLAQPMAGSHAIFVLIALICVVTSEGRAAGIVSTEQRPQILLTGSGSSHFLPSRRSYGG